MLPPLVAWIPVRSHLLHVHSPFRSKLKPSQDRAHRHEGHDRTAEPTVAGIGSSWEASRGGASGLSLPGEGRGESRAPDPWGQAFPFRLLSPCGVPTLSTGAEERLEAPLSAVLKRLDRDSRRERGVRRKRHLSLRRRTPDTQRHA